MDHCVKTLLNENYRHWSIQAPSVKKFKAIHILVNNAGTCGRVSLDELSEEIWNRDIDTNTKATYLFIQATVYSHMLIKNMFVLST